MLILHFCQIPVEKMLVGIHCHDRKSEYTSAWDAGNRLALDMIAQGAGAILEAAKATSKKEIIAEHEKKKAQAEVEVENSVGDLSRAVQTS